MKKEEDVLKLFFEEPSKQWHFEQILVHAKISRPQANLWLKKFLKEGFIQRIKNKGAMPYYLASFENVTYKMKKRVYTLQKLYATGLLSHLYSLPKAKTIIIFGSMSRADWYKESDLDLFVYGSADTFEKGLYERKLSREIQIFTAQNEKDLQKLGSGLLRNILKGYLIKGELDTLIPHASIQKS